MLHTFSWRKLFLSAGPRSSTPPSGKTSTCVELSSLSVLWCWVSIMAMQPKWWPENRDWGEHWHPGPFYTFHMLRLSCLSCRLLFLSLYDIVPVIHKIVWLNHLSSHSSLKELSRQIVRCVQGDWDGLRWALSPSLVAFASAPLLVPGL